jgi:hypothetical protein
MNLSWPHRTAGKAERRGAARALMVGVTAVAVAGAAAMAAPGAFAATKAAHTKDATKTTMSAVSGYVGSNIKLAAKVTGSTPKGTVKFIWGSKTLCSGTLSNGAAHCNHAFAGVGSYRVEAYYEGNATHKVSSGTATVKVLAVKTSVKVTASPAATSTNKNVTFTAVLTPSSSAGTVTFSVGASKLGSATVKSGKATFTHPFGAGGAYTVTATYGGNATHAKSSGTTKVTVTAADATTTVITITGDNYSPTLNWENAGPVEVPFTVTNNVPGGAAPTGTVTLSDPADIPDQPKDPSFAGCTGKLTPGANGVSTGECQVTTTPGVAAPAQYAVWGFVLMRATYTPSSAAFATSNTGDTEYKILNLMPTATAVTPAAGTVGTAVPLVATVVPSGAAADSAGTAAGNLLAAFSEQIEDGPAGDTGDTVSFTANGDAIAGCQNLPLLWNATTMENYADCSYTPAADGTVAIAAVFSGDEYATTSTGTENLAVTG